ncbi:TonB-dependent receptor [Porticoccaceae bacterium]|nr:TonB-dependent receptor [Porticoccaceae bacterium]
MKAYRRYQLAVAVSAVMAMPAIAASTLDEIVVTAQKREQNLQDIPIALSAFDKTALEQQGISDIEDAGQYLPNVQIVESPTGSTGATISIRGSVTINPAVTWEPTVGIYMDGVFIAKNVGGIFDIAELERLEVLRGPQGTLYGKNTVGGAINLVTKKPTGEQGGKVTLGAGNYSAKTAAISLDSPMIADKASFNLSYMNKTRDGFDDNLATGKKLKELDSEAGRLSVLVQASDNTTIQYSYDWSDVDNTPSLAQMVAVPDYNRPASASMDGAIYDRSSTDGHSVIVTRDLDNMQFKSITAHREMSFDDTVDLDGSAAVGFHTERHVSHEQFSQEFQLIASIGDIDLVGGLFYFNEKADANNPYDFGFAKIRNNYGVDSVSLALYSQADWHVNDQLTLTGGLRWSREEKDFYMSHPDDFVAPFDAQSNDSWSNVSPSFVVSYAWNDDLTTYAKVADGWKSGGFNGESENITLAQTPYDEETVTSYEIGVKSRLNDDRIQLNVALFQNNITELQLSEFRGASGYSFISNAGEATVKGFEVEMLAALSDNLQVNMNYGYLDAQYDQFLAYGFDIKDTALFPYTPDNSFSAGLEYAVDNFSVRMDYSHVDDHVAYYDQPSADATAIEGYSLLNARISLSGIGSLGSNGLKLALWGKNLTDEEYYLNGIPLGPVALNYFGNPRTVGVDVVYEF